MQQQLRLITIPVSHYCEKVRWSLDYLKLPYVEQPHMPPFHRLSTTKFGGKSAPVLVTKDGNFIDSTDILKYLDLISDEVKLYSNNPEYQQQIEELEDFFDEKLGKSVRSWGYFYGIENKKVIRDKWCQGVPLIEKLLFPIVYPKMRSIVKKKYIVDEESVAQAYEQIKSVFAKVSDLLADGREYLIGDKISAADITFAALTAPILQPPQHPIKSSESRKLPKKMLSGIKEFRGTIAGQFALDLYENWRYER